MCTSVIEQLNLIWFQYVFLRVISLDGKMYQLVMYERTCKCTYWHLLTVMLT